MQNKYSLWRLCVDNRKLNEKIIQDVYPIPRILDLLVDLILPMTEKSNVINLVCLQQLLYYESKTMDMYKIETLEHKASAYKVSIQFNYLLNMKYNSVHCLFPIPFCNMCCRQYKNSVNKRLSSLAYSYSNSKSISKQILGITDPEITDTL